MTESDATPEASRETSSDPRRIVLADLEAHLAAGVMKQAQDYAAAAARADGHLRQVLEELVRRKRAQTADLLALGPGLGVPVPAASPATSPSSSAGWGTILGEAFQGERMVERIARELAVLASEPALKALGARLAAGAARDGQEVRKLYLQYT
jgi:hypothetical protein